MAEKVDGIKLKPCPFCGGEAKTEEFVKNFGPTLIECSNCGAIVTFDKDEINKWNRRNTAASCHICCQCIGRLNVVLIYPDL